MAISSEDKTEIQLLILQEVDKLLHESNGFSEARRAVDKRMRELESELLDDQRSREHVNGMWKTDPKS